MIFHGAYGFRWRRAFEHDQLQTVISLLLNHPQSRRAVIQMWDCESDLHSHEKVKDIPCNLVVTPWINNQLLDMTVFCRSNDAIWGAAGANAVQFSILQEYLAAMIGVGVGTLYQISNNFHAYDEIFEKLKTLRPDPVHSHYGNYGGHFDEYTAKRVVPTKLIDDPAYFDSELHHFFKWHDERLGGPFTQEDEQTIDMKYTWAWKNTIFSRVAIPMVKAYMIYRRCKDDPNQFEMIDQELDTSGLGRQHNDWLYAAKSWMIARSIKH